MKLEKKTISDLKLNYVPKFNTTIFTKRQFQIKLTANLFNTLKYSLCTGFVTCYWWSRSLHSQLDPPTTFCTRAVSPSAKYDVVFARRVEQGRRLLHLDICSLTSKTFFTS